MNVTRNVIKERLDHDRRSDAVNHDRQSDAVVCENHDRRSDAVEATIAEATWMKRRC